MKLLITKVESTDGDIELEEVHDVSNMQDTALEQIALSVFEKIASPHLLRYPANTLLCSYDLIDLPAEGKSEINYDKHYALLDEWIAKK